MPCSELGPSSTTFKYKSSVIWRRNGDVAHENPEPCWDYDGRLRIWSRRYRIRNVMVVRWRRGLSIACTLCWDHVRSYFGFDVSWSRWAWNSSKKRYLHREKASRCGNLAFRSACSGYYLLYMGKLVIFHCLICICLFADNFGNKK